MPIREIKVFDFENYIFQIKAIHMPEYYSHALANYQSDIAVLILKKPFVYNKYVSRVCLDFTRTFNDQQLEAGNLGKVRQNLFVWSLTHYSSKFRGF